MYTGYNNDTFVMKGCIRSGRCKEMEMNFRLFEILDVESVKCIECEEDGCNSTSKFSVGGIINVTLVLIVFNLIKNIL